MPVTGICFKGLALDDVPNIFAVVNGEQVKDAMLRIAAGFEGVTVEPAALLAAMAWYIGDVAAKSGATPEALLDLLGSALTEHGIKPPAPRAPPPRPDGPRADVHHPRVRRFVTFDGGRKR